MSLKNLYHSLLYPGLHALSMFYTKNTLCINNENHLTPKDPSDEVPAFCLTKEAEWYSKTVFFSVKPRQWTS